MTTHEDIGPAEHGARRGIFFARCSCGQPSFPPRRSLAAASADISRHLAAARNAQRLTTQEGS